MAKRISEEDLLSSGTSWIDVFSDVLGQLGYRFNSIESVKEGRYLTFLDSNDQVVSYITYRMEDTDQPGVHPIKGSTFTDLYRELNFLAISYIFGTIKRF